MFGLDPFSRPVAIAEILLLLALAAFVGWLLGRLVLNGRINAVRADIADKKAELDECRQSGILTPRPERVTEIAPVSVVAADPLLPAFSRDDSPGPVAADALLPTRSAGENYSNNGPVAGPPASAGMPMAENSEAAVLSRIAARAGEVNFDRIGRATAAEADDLKDIIGVGPFLERKLHSLGIYTFRQIASFTGEDADTVNRIIEFFPGRIERDHWVDQAKAFHERKYGQQP